MTEPVIFWTGCNVLRHGEIIHACIDILRALGFDPVPRGGPDYCCGTVKDDNQTTAGGMASRTVNKFNAIGLSRLIAWCPSCHAHMHDFMEKANDVGFKTEFLVDVIYRHRAQLIPLLTHQVNLRVVLHKHVGFNDLVPVNSMVSELLRIIPGIEVIEVDYVTPGYMCVALATVPGAIEDMHKNLVQQVERNRADAVVTTFHQCYRELCGLEAAGVTQVFNYIHLIARAMGLTYEDQYKTWKKAGAQAMDLIGEERVSKVGIEFFRRAVLPELQKRPKLSASKERQ